MTNDKVRVRWNIDVRPAHGVFEFKRSDWDAMTPMEREAAIDEQYDVEMSNASNGGWSVENADTDDPTVED